MNTFNPGEKVVCVDGFYDVRCAQSAIRRLHKGQIYVVRSTNWPNGIEGVRLVGIVNECDNLGDEFCYLVSRFRKLSEIKAAASAENCRADALAERG